MKKIMTILIIILSFHVVTFSTENKLENLFTFSTNECANEIAIFKKEYVSLEDLKMLKQVFRKMYNSKLNNEKESYNLDYNLLSKFCPSTVKYYDEFLNKVVK
jgi:hypothetical protein